MRPTVATQLRLERGDDSEVTDKGAEGFTLVEMANMIERLTGDLGIQGRFAPLVVVFGHGSSSLNNPHESAYNCGACGGGQGGPNARAVAQMANDLRVRAILDERGLAIPNTTLFVGGFHNTCDDLIHYSDVDRIPLNHTAKFLAACEIIERARQRNAHERARRFYSLDMTSSDEEALRHVEQRSESILSIMDRNPLINTTIRNHWVQIATLDPTSNLIQLFQDDRFEPYEPGPQVLPTVPVSLDWYRGWREPLGFSKVDASAVATQACASIEDGI